MRRNSSLIMLAADLLLISGCGFTATPARYFEVSPTAIARQPGAGLPSVMVPDFSCLSAYDHLRIVRRKSVVEVVTSRNLQWTTVPGRMLAQGLRFRLEATGRFETVRRDVKPRPPYSVEGIVQVIELDENPKLTARLALHLNFRRNADGAVIGEEFVDESREAEGKDPADGVLALRGLYSDILDGLVDRIIAAVERDLQRAGSEP